MTRYRRYGMLLAVALMASTAAASNAHAQAVWHPDNTEVVGVAEDTTLDFGGTVLVCDESTVSGATGVASSILDLELAFSGECDLSGLGTTVSCSTMDPSTGDGGMRLTAVDPVDDTGTVELNDGFSCSVVVTGVCALNISGPQSGGSFALDETAGLLTIEGEWAYTRNGSALCAPPAGTVVFVEEYDVSGGLEIRPHP